MKSFSMSLVVMLIAASIAAADLTFRYVDWRQGPVRYLMTQEEMTQWNALASDEAAQAFIDLFWARRDPTPQTARNEFRDEFDARVARADRELSTPRGAGSMSDRGKVLILLGPPWQIGSRGAAIRSLSNQPPVPFPLWDGNVSVLSPRAEPARQTWTYGYARKPKFIKKKEVTFLFVDEGREDWQLALTERTNPGEILRQAVEYSITSPGLTVAPLFAKAVPDRVTSFRSAELKSVYETFRGEESASFGPAHLTWGEFVTPGGDRFASVQLYVPASAGIEAGRKVTFFGVVESSPGGIVEIHEAEALMKASGGDVYVDMSLRLEPGNYTAVFGLASPDGKPLAMSKTRMLIEGLDPKASGVSPLILSNNIQPLQEAWEDTDPFTFGGLKVVPKGDSLFAPIGDLWYFLELRNPGLTEQGAPNVKVKVDIEGKSNERPVRMAFPMADAEIAKLKGTNNRYAVGMAIPLEGFRPGEYTMKIRVMDSVLGKNYDLEKQFRVRGL